MAAFIEPTPEIEAAWKEWLAERPEKIRAVAERFNPWSLYRLKDTGQRVTILSFGEDEDGKVKMRVNVSAQFNFLLFERQVFGIDPDDLTPCELPAPDKPVGAALTTPEEVEAHIEGLRRKRQAEMN